MYSPELNYLMVVLSALSSEGVFCVVAPIINMPCATPVGFKVNPSLLKEIAQNALGIPTLSAADIAQTTQPVQQTTRGPHTNGLGKKYQSV